MNKIIFFVSVILLVSCSQEQESMSNALQTDDSTWDENGVGFAEFLGCAKGPDFARENLEEMSDELWTTCERKKYSKINLKFIS